jgi:CRP-like cAMP-binding protein
MEPLLVKAGDWVIKQGTVGDRFYIVDEGRFEVRIVPDNHKDDDGTGGNCVHVYEGSRESNSHPSFGELALMHSAPRAASIIAQTDGLLWALHRYAFKKVISERTLRKDSAFSSESLKDLSSSLCAVKFSPGDVILNEGDVGDSLYIVLPGGSCKSVRCSSKDGSESEIDLKEGAIFGEEVLEDTSQHKYLSTVTTSSKLTCMALRKSDAKRVISSAMKGNTDNAK